MKQAKIIENKKTERIIVRTSLQQKEKIKQNAQASGLSMTDYLVESATKKTIVSSFEGRQLIKIVHEINLHLYKLEQQGVSVQDLQDYVSKSTMALQKRIQQIETGLE